MSTISVLSAAGVGLAFVVSRVPSTGSLNPFKQIEIMDGKYREKQELIARYDRLYQEFLTFADSDSSGVIDFGEQVNAWRKMGDKRLYFESRGDSQFVTPTLEGLEKAVESFKNN